MKQQLIVWIPIALLFAWFFYLYLRGKRCELCHREFGVYRRRYKGNGLWRFVRLCRKHRDEWDAKYAFKGSFT